MKKLLGILPTILVMALALALLLFVGLGEARRVYESFQLEKLAAQGELIQRLTDDFLEQGLPLDFVAGLIEEELGKFAGFAAFGKSETSAQTLTLIDPDGRLVYPEVEPPFLDQPALPLEVATVPYAVARGAGRYRMILPLMGRFEEPSGELVVSMPTALISDFVQGEFRRLLRVGGFLLLVFLPVALLLEVRSPKRKTRWLELAYGLNFLAMAVAVVLSLVGIYRHGAQAKTDALADSLAQRIGAVAEAGVPLDQVAGLSEILAEFQSNSTDIRTVALVRDETVVAHPDPEAISRAWTSRPGDHEHLVAIPGGDVHVRVAVVIPGEVVREKIQRAVKNFAALFVASLFLAFLLLNASTSYQEVRALGKTGDRDGPMVGQRTISSYMFDYQDLWLNVLQAVWFLVVFMEGLNASFLPHYLQDTAGADLPAFVPVVLFTAFFAAFVAVLVPAGQFAEKREVKYLLLGGLTLTMIGLLIMAFSTDLYALLLARILGGAGQGIAFIGVQAYILLVGWSRKTQGSAKQVFAQNGGVISGAAIGALLVVYLEEAKIFLAGAGGAALTLVFIWWMLPRVGGKARMMVPSAKPSQAPKGFREQLKVILEDFEFIRTFFLVGAASKVVYNGVVFFSIPLIMKQQQYEQEDIGQVLMLFAGAVLIANHFVAKLADRLGQVRLILFLGMMISGAGALLVGLTDWLDTVTWGGQHLDLTALSVGVFILGLANGFIAAPVVSHILDTHAAKVLGSSSAVSVYRLLERLGHVAGPLIVGQLLILNQQKAATIAWVGCLMLVFGVLFLTFGRRKDPEQYTGIIPLEPEGMD